MNQTHDPYDNGFSDWDDVQSQFRMDEPEPDQVLYARYAYECYEGDAQVIYRRGNTFYEVTGGHCSCYGLEDQWDPEPYTAEEFKASLQRRPAKRYDDILAQAFPDE